MNALFGLFIAAGVVYGVLIDGTFWKIYGVMVFFYAIFVLYQRDRKENPKRKTITISSWNRKYIITHQKNLLLTILFAL